MDRDTRLKALRYRAWHRGTKEADLLIGGFFEAVHSGWNDADIALFEALIEEQDVDIMAWAMGTAPVPTRFKGPLIAALKRLNYVPVSQ